MAQNGAPYNPPYNPAAPYQPGFRPGVTQSNSGNPAAPYQPPVSGGAGTPYQPPAGGGYGNPNPGPYQPPTNASPAPYQPPGAAPYKPPFAASPNPAPYQPPGANPNPAPYQPSAANPTPVPYQPTPGGPGTPYQPSTPAGGAPYKPPFQAGTSAPYQPPVNNPSPAPTTGTPYQPPAATGTPYQPAASAGTPYKPPGAVGTPYQPPVSTGAPAPGAGTPYQPPASAGTPAPYQPPASNPYQAPATGTPYQPAGTPAPAPFQPGGSQAGAYQPPVAAGTPYGAPTAGQAGPYQPANPNPAPFQAGGPAGGYQPPHAGAPPHQQPVGAYGQPGQPSHPGHFQPGPDQHQQFAPPPGGFQAPQQANLGFQPHGADVMIFVREVGSVDYDPMFLNDSMSFEELQAVIQETLGRKDEITKISLDGIAIRNVTGMKFMFKKADPKLEVSFAGSAGGAGPAQPGLPPHAAGTQYPGAARSTWEKPSNAWLTVLERNPYSFGHSGTPINNQLFVFGGFVDGDDSSNQCLLLTDTKGGKFHKLSVSGQLPTVRERHTANLIGKKVFLFGGYNRQSDTYFNTLHCFDSESLTMEAVTARGTLPEPRCGHTTVVLDNKLWVFGGRVKVKLGTSFFSETVVEYRRDLHCYDPVKNEWQAIEARGQGPSGRSMHTATIVDRIMYIFGGANSTGTRDDTSGFCDLYQLDFDTMTWSECQTKGTPPTPCYGHSASEISGGRILFFGGKGYAVTNDIHCLILSTLEWKKYAFAGNQLVPRWGHTGTLHDNRVVLYGGRDAGGYWSTYDSIDVDKELIELAPEESAADILRREAEEAKVRREIIGGLQSEMEELKVVITRIGEELINQKKDKAEILNQLSLLEQENNYYRQKIYEYKMARFGRA